MPQISAARVEVHMIMVVPSISCFLYFIASWFSWAMSYPSMQALLRSMNFYLRLVSPYSRLSRFRKECWKVKPPSSASRDDSLGLSRSKLKFSRDYGEGGSVGQLAICCVNQIQTLNHIKSTNSSAYVYHPLTFGYRALLSFPELSFTRILNGNFSFRRFSLLLLRGNPKCNGYLFQFGVEHAFDLSLLTVVKERCLEALGEHICFLRDSKRKFLPSPFLKLLVLL